MKLTGDKVELRLIRPEDYATIVEWTQEKEVNRFIDGDYPTSVSECAAWDQKAKSNRYQERFAIVLNNSIIGDIELDHITWRSGDAELRIRIGVQSLWDQGYGTDAINTLLHYAFDSLNLSRIYLKVYVDNSRAIRCYQKVGFKKEGRLSRRLSDIDVRKIFLMRILKSEFFRKQGLLDEVI